MVTVFTMTVEIHIIIIKYSYELQATYKVYIRKRNIKSVSHIKHNYVFNQARKENFERLRV